VSGGPSWELLLTCHTPILLLVPDFLDTVPRLNAAASREAQDNQRVARGIPAHPPTIRAANRMITGS
jgi:hypothetical protein